MCVCMEGNNVICSGVIIPGFFLMWCNGRVFRGYTRVCAAIVASLLLKISASLLLSASASVYYLSASASVYYLSAS